MDPDNKETVPPEIRVTATLLLDSEKKIEELRSQLDKLGKAESPTLNLNPPVASTYNKQNTPIANQRADIVARIADLKSRSLQIVEEIERKSPTGVAQRVGRLKQEWIKDLEPAQADETKTLFETQKRATRSRNKDWLGVELSLKPAAPFQQNKEDIEVKKPSYMDKARGLKAEYAYLDKDVDGPTLGKEESTPGI